MKNMQRDGFILKKHQGVSYYSCRALEMLPWLRHGFSTRHGDNSFSDPISMNLGDVFRDSTTRVGKNRQRFLTALNFENAHLVILRQVHSSRAHIINDISGQWNQTEGDALMTGSENIALAVTVADCLPVLIADPANKAVAAVHSGWKGTLARVLPQAILEMRRAFNSNPEQLIVAAGPGIGSCCYEVGSEVAREFDREYPGYRLSVPAAGRSGKFYLDLLRALDAQLDGAGVPPENRFELGACTRCAVNEFFSFRAEGPQSGRMMGVIGIAPD
ncbi:MAG TPA: peptidoglycan editing factor PgeF [Acidobacteriota bacterium]|nr:peptidoglycan editing factor PgeF [Acidobacteriota bacterium]